MTTNISLYSFIDSIGRGINWFINATVHIDATTPDIKYSINAENCIRPSLWFS